MDLAQSFGPTWAREGDTRERHEQLAKKHGGGEEPRGRKGGRRDDFGSRGPRKPRPGGDRDRGGKRATSGRRDDVRDGRRGAPPERKPEPTLKGWDLRFLPDRRGVDGLAKQIKSSARAFPLFDLARLVLEKSERYVVEFKRAGDDAQPLWQVKEDGTLWTSETEAIARALSANIDKFYRRDRVTVDPPKGTFPFVAVCGMSGILLGPPNYHDYQSKVVKLYQERFSNLPFDVFKNRIKMERDEALIEKWREDASSRDVFYPVSEAADGEDESQPRAKSSDGDGAVDSAVVVEPAEVAEAPAGEMIQPDAAEANSVTESTAEVGAPEVEDAGETPDAGEAAVVEETSVSEGAAEGSEPESAEVAPVDVPAESESGALSGERFESMMDVEAHFRANHGAKAVVAIRDRVVTSGSAALNDSAPAVLELSRGKWDELDRFPLPMAHGLGQQLASKGLQVFKLGDKITYVGVARPRWLDLDANPVSETLKGILTYLSEHGKTPRAEQWAGLVGLLPAEMPDRESAVARDLSWLLHEGYVVDFARKGLWAVERPKSSGRDQAAAPKNRAGKAKAKPIPESSRSGDTSVAPEKEADTVILPAPVESASTDEPAGVQLPDSPVAPELPATSELSDGQLPDSPVAPEIPAEPEAPGTGEAPATPDEGGVERQASGGASPTE
ncbi:MAG: hypothetical protein WA771_04355 [Chthoniobacterales bacterium]